MSELTPCNRCSFERIKRDAEARGATAEAIVAVDPAQPMFGWVAVVVSDRDTPVGWMQVLTEACAC